MGVADRGIPFCLPQDAPSRVPENFDHGSRSWELFVSGMSVSAAEILRFLAPMIFPRNERMEKEAVERKPYLERVDVKPNYPRKGLCTVFLSPQLI